MKYFSMFSGIGGFELGIEQAYVDISNRQRNKQRWVEIQKGDTLPKQIPMAIQPLCIGYSEIDKYAIQIYKRHFNHKNYGNATTINATELPDFNLLVGGFPCQAFSIAGKRAGLDDTRGTLFYDIARIAKEKRPEHLLLENVKGLLSHDNGRTFKLITSTFAELGYNLEWQVLNSKNFGVPQNRERVFIVGHLGRCCGRQIFPLGKDDGLPNEADESDGSWSQTELSTTDRIGMGTKADSTFIEQLNNPTHSNDRVYGTSGLAPTLNTMQGGNRQPFVAMNPRNFQRKSYVEGNISIALSQPSGNNATLVKGNSRIRRLTPTECERLQAYPDGWTKEGINGIISDTQRYKTLGNSVTVSVIEHLIQKLYE